MNNKEIARTALFIAIMSSFLMPFMASSVNIAIPQIGKYFSMNAIVMSWIATANLLTAAMFLVPFGRLADIYGRKKIFSYGISLYTISSFLCGISPSSLFLIVSRALQGLSGAMIFGTAVAILVSISPSEERGKVLGINVSSVYIGLSLGPFLGGFLTQHFGWRSIFFINVPFGILIILTVYWKLKGEWAESYGESYDHIGAILYSIMLIFIIYGFSILPSSKGFMLILIGIVALMIFIKKETNTSSPVLEINLFKENKAFFYSNFAALINYSATFTVNFLLSIYLQTIKKFSPQNAGIILILQPLIMAIFSPLAGKLSDKTEPRIIASIGMALTSFGLFLLIFLNKSTSIYFIICCLITLGLGLALFSSPNTNAVMSSVNKKFYGIAAGIIGTMRLIGQAFSMGIVMLIFSLILGKNQITAQNYVDFLHSLNILFILFTILCFFGIFLSLSRGNIRN